MSNRRYRSTIGQPLPGVFPVAPAAPPAMPPAAGAPPQIQPGMPQHGGHLHHRIYGGPWFHGYPWAYPTVPYSTGIEISDLLFADPDPDPEPSEEEKKKDTKALAKEIVKQLKRGRVVVGDDLELLDAEEIVEEPPGWIEMLGEEKEGSSGGGFSGFDVAGPILQTAGNLFQGGINIYDAHEAKKKAEEDKARSSAEERTRINAAISADAAAAKAAAKAAVSAKLKQPSMTADATAASVAASAQARAAAKLSSPEALERRLEAANTALSAATSKAQASPRDVHAAALMNAWLSMLNRIQNAQFTSSSASVAQSTYSSESWWHRLLRWLGLE